MNNLRLKLATINLMTLLLVSCNGKKDAETRLVPEDTQETSSEELNARYSDRYSRTSTEEKKVEDKVITERDQGDSGSEGDEDRNPERVLCADYDPAGNNILRCDLYVDRYKDEDKCDGQANTPYCEVMQQAALGCLSLQMAHNAGTINLNQLHSSAPIVGTSGTGNVGLTWVLHGGSWQVDPTYDGQTDSQSGCDKSGYNIGTMVSQAQFDNYCMNVECKNKAQDYLDEDDTNPYAGLY